MSALSSIRVGERTRHDLGDIASLARSIEQHGLLHPIVVTETGELIAGERRLEAFRLLGRIEIPTRVVDIEHLVFGEQAENINRKDFTPEERVTIGEKIEALLGERRGRPSSEKVENFPPLGKTRDIAAQQAGFRNAKTYEQAKTVCDANREDPEKFAKPLADMNRTGRVHGPFKRVKIAKQSAEIRREPPPLPGRGPYRVITADPPWPYEKRDEDPSHRAVLPYPTMSIAQITALRIADIAHENCVLWLWTTNAHMRESFCILDNWGFEQKTILTWVKDRFGHGDWLRGQTEHALMATRGQPTVQLTNESTVLFAPVRAHSQKPDEFYALVERLCPASRYAELFSRHTRPNWDGHGDEATGAP
jgi:N6-adenosine-specific RNA methylase IME4